MWKMFLTQPVVMGVARHVLTTGGGALVAKGVVEASQMETLTGAALAIVGVLFSIWKNKVAD